MVPVHLKETSRRVLQDIQLPPFRAQWKKTDSGNHPFFITEIEGTTYTSLPSHNPRRHTLKPGDHIQQIRVPGYFPCLFFS